MSKNIKTTDIAALTASDLPNAMTRADVPATFATTTKPSLSCLQPDAYIGQPVVVNSAPSAWKGILVAVNWHPAGFGVSLADSAMWTQAEVNDIINPGRQAKNKLPAYHGFVSHVPLCTAFQPAGADGNHVKFRGELCGDPAVITLAHYAEHAGQKLDIACAGLNKIMDVKEKPIDDLVKLVQSYADSVRFPVRAVASILASEVLRRRW